ncbi:unnamed protein product [Danaus chrysippus]|uniref:(African queen) hypothetical protein n=1 Tax=Danaus chrysippus TaxID=151541 RepID=A0A8J2QIK1_9NEOP|nr:unnamed protein product [Danaus chrysippus]
MEPFNWRGIGYLGSLCPDREDICVKLIEKKGAQEVITRDCLSNFKAIRKDIPADTYEGCRPAVPDVTLAHYVNNSIKQLDIKSSWQTSLIGRAPYLCSPQASPLARASCQFILLRGPMPGVPREVNSLLEYPHFRSGKMSIRKRNKSPDTTSGRIATTVSQTAMNALREGPR